jgi:hypothetical protein
MENVIEIIFILFSICFIATTFARADSDFFVCCLGGTCAFAISLLVLIICDCPPTPMDVYQGKTTLEYKVVDGIKVDSTVIWKEE